MPHWILNRLISLSLDASAVLGASAAVAHDAEAARRLRRLSADAAAAAQEVALLQHRTGGRPVLAGTAQGAERCRAVEQAAALGVAALPGALATAMRSIGEAISACERLLAAPLPPLVRAAVEATAADLQTARVEVASLAGGGAVRPQGRPATAAEIRFGLFPP
jgi:uncharacterized protein (TIGR02284 family)